MSQIVAIATVAKPNSFSYHLIGEPQSLNPSELNGLSARYLFFNIYRNLYKYNSKNELVPELAEVCTWKTSKILYCNLRKDIKWSNGDPIVAQNFIRGYQLAFTKTVKSTASMFLLDIKNSKLALEGKIEPKDIGVRAIDKTTIEFKLTSENREFLHNLATLQTSPVPMDEIKPYPNIKNLLSSGPYVIKSWVPGKKVILKSNPYYFNKTISRPNVEILFVEHDQTALDLYLKKKINLLRRVPAHLSKRFKNDIGYLETDLYRFDYIGFNSKSIPREKRKSLIHSLNYTELQKVYEAKTPPGCPSLPRVHFDKYPCYEFKKKLPLLKNFRSQLGYSSISGEGVRVGMEWMQFQWKKNLNAKIELNPFELGTLTPALKLKSLPIFRKSVHIDRPTCLAALELFSKENPENYTGFHSKAFEEIILKMRSSTSLTEIKKYCSAATKELMDSYLMIPLGQIHLTMVHDAKFKGFFLNGLDVLDLTDLVENK